MNLQRGQRGMLDKQFDLHAPVTIRVQPTGAAVYDCCCFGLDAAEKLSDDRYMIFYNQTQAPNQEISYRLDGNSTVFSVSIHALPNGIQRLAFTVSIDGSGVMGDIVRLTVTISQDDREPLVLQLNGSDFSQEKAIVALEFYQKNGWRYAAIARGFHGGLADLLHAYGGVEEQASAAQIPAQPVVQAPVPVIDDNEEDEIVLDSVLSPVNSFAEPAADPAPVPVIDDNEEDEIVLDSVLPPVNAFTEPAADPAPVPVIDDNEEDEIVLDSVLPPINSFTESSADPAPVPVIDDNEEDEIVLDSVLPPVNASTEPAADPAPVPVIDDNEEDEIVLDSVLSPINAFAEPAADPAPVPVIDDDEEDEIVLDSVLPPVNAFAEPAADPAPVPVIDDNEEDEIVLDSVLAPSNAAPKSEGCPPQTLDSVIPTAEALLASIRKPAVAPPPTIPAAIKVPPPQMHTAAPIPSPQQHMAPPPMPNMAPPQMQNMMPPLQNMAPPQMQNMVPPQMQNMMPPPMQNMAPPQMQNMMPPPMQNMAPPRMHGMAPPSQHVQSMNVLPTPNVELRKLGSTPVNLLKHEKVELRKENNETLTKVRVGLGWDAAHLGLSIDCDSSVFLCQNGKLCSTQDIVAYYNLRHISGAVVHQGDNLTGDGDGDDEQIVIDLTAMPPQYDRIVIVVNIYMSRIKMQHFGKIKNCYMRLCDMNGKELCRFALSDSKDYDKKTAMIFGELLKQNDSWIFHAIGQGTNDHSIGALANHFK